MEKKLILLVISLFFLGCTQKKEEDINLSSFQEVTPQKNEFEDLTRKNVVRNDFFDSKEFTYSKKDDQCIDDSNGDFVAMKDCTYDMVYDIKENIKNKISRLNKNKEFNNQWLESEYSKIVKKCSKEVSEKLEDDLAEASAETDSYISVCVRDTFYKLGRNLK